MIFKKQRSIPSTKSSESQTYQSIFSAHNQITEFRLPPLLDSLQSSGIFEKVFEVQKNCAKSFPKNFQCYEELENKKNREYLTQPFLTPFENYQYNSTKSKNSMGVSKKRKRSPIPIQANNILELINNYVIPRWKYYLLNKNEVKIACTEKPRPDTLWKKMLRDVREFFRILFRSRFYYLEYREHLDAEYCVKTLFKELNISFDLENQDISSLFNFLHQSHKSRFPQPSKKLPKSPYEVIEKYNEEHRKLFMTNKLCSQMFYFVFKNYIQEYCKIMKPRYKQEIVTKIVMMLNCYRRMTREEDIHRINFLLKSD